MRNSTFISSMVLSVACVSAANASVTPPGFVSIDDFQISSTADGSVNPSAGGAFTDAPGAYGAAGLRQTYGGGRNNGGTTGQAWATTAIGSGAMTMSYGGVAASVSTGSQDYKWVNKSSWNFGYITDQPGQPAVQTAQALFATSTTWDWSSGTNFSFDISGFTTGGVSTYNTPLLRMFVYDQVGNFSGVQVALADGHVDVNFSQFAGIDFSQLDYVAFQFENTYTTALPKNTSGIPTGSLTITNFGYVPAPGAVALLGAGGLIGARRRRG